MTYEVEQKFPVTDWTQTRARLEALGVRPRPAVEQIDTYLAHPVRDFAATDEAFRVRRVGERLWITYKGPKLDPHTKTRREIELAIDAAHNEEQVLALFEQLSFHPVTVVRKQRHTAELSWRQRTFLVALDDVAELGRFVELETVVSESDLDAARDDLQQLAEQLGLHSPERRSYLDLLLISRGGRPAEPSGDD